MWIIKFNKIARFMNIADTTNIRDIFWKNRFKHIKKIINTIGNNPNIYSEGIKKATLEDLQEFYVLYKEEIIKKNNAKVYNLIEIYKPQILGWKQIYFSYIRENNVLLAWWISVYRILRGKETLMGCVKAWKNTDVMPSILYYIEYLFFRLWLELHVKQFSAGKDRNAYWYLGESIWLAIHKLQNHYLPYKSNDKEEFEIEDDEIKDETILFIPNPNKNNLCDKATLRTNKTQEQIEEEFVLLKKRWISLNIQPLSIK